MSAFNTRGVIYATNCTLAALLALYVAFSAGLPNPGWASLTVFLVSQPLGAASGSVVSRALYRSAGTLTGVIASMLILPMLVQTPELMIAAVAAWVALCVYVSLLDRSPRNYAFLLSGYTVALVGLPLIGDVSQLFDIGVARIEEIIIGASSAVLVHSLLFPRALKSQMDAKLGASLKDARAWMTAALSPQGSTTAEQAARRRLAADLTELHQFANGQRFDADAGAADIRIVSALEARLVALLPLMTAVEDRLGAMGEAMPPALVRYVAEVRQWIEEVTQADQDRVDQLVAAEQQALPAPGTLPAWTEILAVSAVQRLAELVEAWNDCLHLTPFVHEPVRAQDARARQLANSQGRRLLHVDHGMAAYAGLAAGVAVVLAGAVAMAMGWAQGATTIGLAAAGSSVFAFLDDPRPMQKLLVVWSLIAVPVAALYVFAILPSLDGFGAFALALSPLYFTTALYLTTPQHGLRALSFALVSQTLLALQPALHADFDSFTNVAVGSVVGSLIALLVTSLIRVVSPETSASRILRAGWRDLAALAAGRRSTVPQAWASRMLDRVGLLIPRLARVAGDAGLARADALNDLRLGITTVVLREVAREAEGGPLAPSIDTLMRHLALHFRAQAREGQATPAAALLGALDDTIRQLLALGGGLRLKGLAAATGLRRGLFPEAPPFQDQERAS